MANIFSDIASLFGLGGQQGGSSSKNTYVPTGLGSADTTYQGLLGQGSGQVSGAEQYLNPQLMAALSQYLGIDTSGLTNSANQAGQLYQNQIAPALSAQNNLMQNAQNIQGAGNQLYQTAFDPQQALYNRYLQQTQDTANAGGAMRGIGMSPEAAGLTNQATNNFLQQWQNQQVGREATGVQGLSQAYNQAGQNYAGALNAGALSPYYAQQSGAVPYGANVQAASQPFNAAGAYWNATQPQNLQAGNLMNSIISYLNQGAGATGQAFNQAQTGLGNLAGLATYNYGSTQNPQTLGGSALGALGNLFGSSGGAAGSASPGLDASLFFGP